MSNDPPKPSGESIAPEWTIAWLDEGITIPADTMLMPAKLAGESAERLADTTLIIGDLHFSLECFKAAAALGAPDVSNTNSKALIFSAVTAYARPFETGRRLRLRPSDFGGVQNFDPVLHQYLFRLRGKHISHPVNAFERCQTVAVMTAPADNSAAPKFGRAIGTIKQSMIGLTLRHLEVAIVHIGATIAHLSSSLRALRVSAAADFERHLQENGSWEMAPFYTAPDRASLDKKR